MPSVASAQTSSRGDGAVARASAIAKSLFATNPAPALSLAVANSSGVIWAEALGKANLELGTEATTKHTFRLGSVSKILTATAAARLVAKGLLDLDAPISRYLPDLPVHHRATTLRELFTHRGGVRHFAPKDFDVSAPGGAIYARIYPSNAEILTLFVNDPLVAPPGTRVSYSSFGYTLASLVMEAATGTDFRTLIASEIGVHFELPSLAADDPWALLPARASGYMNQADVDSLYRTLPQAARPRPGAAGWLNIPLSNPAYSWAGAGFLITPTDAARFGAALLDSAQAKIGPAERQVLWTPVTKASPVSPPLGLGWRIDADAAKRPRWHHAGATPGGRCVLVVYPQQALSISLAGNVSAMPLDVLKAASDLADAFN
jgi:CubicO group peptidase (beta-lactamase class C family)